MYQGQLTNLGPFRELLTPAHEKRQKGVRQVHVGVSDCETDNGENARMHEMNTNANDMHLMTWDEMHDMNKMQNEYKNPTTKGIS